MAVMESILLYGCEIWVNALKIETNRKRIALVQRRKALRVAPYYRTVPDQVVLVIVGVIPIDLLALERKHFIVRRDVIGRDAAKREARKLTVRH